MIKQVTGGDMITARFLFREFFEFRPAFKLVLVSNHKPKIRGTDLAIWRRVRLVPFDVTIPPADRDPLLLQRIVADELPGAPIGRSKAAGSGRPKDSASPMK